ncbi:MAG TPA: DinB family protein [Candidatus Acidoferrales bacterium]|nr:DinB family protein [Candidatus Acidoferrales bacterium]
MPKAQAKREFVLSRAMLEAYAVNERMNQYLLENLPEAAWRAEPPGGKGRPIAAIAAHIHNVRHMWLVVSAKGSKIPEKLNRDTCTKKQAMAALAKSAEAIGKLLEAGLNHPEGRVKEFRPDVAGAFGYMVAHEAHHRGQICMLARQVGHPLPKMAGFGMWEWGKLWRECGFGE